MDNNMGIGKKRAVFFSLDGLIALVLIMGLILVSYSLVGDRKTKTQVHYDILDSLSTLKAQESSDNVTQSLISQGLISKGNNSLLEAIGELYVTNKTLASEIIKRNTESIETKYNWGIWYGSALLYAKNTTPLEEARQIDVARGFVSGIKEGETVTGFSSRAFLSSNRKTKHMYLGGYVGDGNVTLKVEYQGNLSAAHLELALNKEAKIYVNGAFAGTITNSSSTLTPTTYDIPVGLFHNGTNLLELEGEKLYVAGGFLKLDYLSDIEYQGTPRYEFPGVKGIINLYDGIYVPSNLSSMKLSLHYQSDYKVIITLGNKTIFNESSSTETTAVKDNSVLETILDYNQLKEKTLPLRTWIENLSYQGQNITSFDVILITDTSGSMDWRMDSDITGTARNCTDANLYAPSTKRISLAKCLDSSFVSTILNATNASRISLVQFSTSANSYTPLTRNFSLLSSTINNYVASGATCVSCAINRAYEILKNESSPDRKKFIVVMTDGVANQRSTPTCTDLTAASGIESLRVAGGANGKLLHENISAEWNNELNPGTNTINGIEFNSSQKGFSVGASGTILEWNGTGWSSKTSPTTSTLSGISSYNETYALAVSTSGNVLKYNGTAWSIAATISNNPSLNAISIGNATYALAVGSRQNRGRVYRTLDGGLSWTEVDTLGANTNLRGVKTFSSGEAWAVGDGGLIRYGNGITWTTQSSPVSDTLYALDGRNSTELIAVGGTNGVAVIIKKAGSGWTTEHNDNTQDTLRSVQTKSTGGYSAVGDGALILTRGASWSRTFRIPSAFQGNSTTGISCTVDNDACTEPESFPSLNAKYSACRVQKETNATIYSVGFGPVAACNFATQTLQTIAVCGNGTMYSSSNASELQQFYETIANNIITLTYSEQTSSTTGNITTILYPDSYLELNFTAPPKPYGISITSEVEFTNLSAGSFTIPQNTTVYEAHVTSYSGPRWTVNARINNKEFFNLNEFGSNYLLLGDPYAISIPLKEINATNLVQIQTGINPTNLSEGSNSNKIVYTLIRNSTGYSPISISAQGCIWTVDTEAGTNVTFTTPEGYNGTNQCYYQTTRYSFDQNDAVQTAVANLFESLDFDNDYRIDSLLQEGDVQIGINQITGIPFSWATEVQVKIWR